jgi:sugar/nucleoside kinase (ribokinase family)
LWAFGIEAKVAVKPTFEIVIPGSYFFDLIFTGLPAFPELGGEVYSRQIDVVPGGGSLNTSIALRRLGVGVGWITRLGNDFFSSYIAQLLEAEELDQTLVQRLDSPLRRVSVALSYPTDRAFVSYTDPTPNVVDMALQTLEQADFRHLHFTGLTIDPRMPGLLRAAHARGIVVSMDCQHRDDTLETPLVRDILSQVDLFMPNALEARRLTQTDSTHAALAVLRAIVPQVVIKQGAEGALAAQGDQVYHSPALAVEVLDTTGAGDVFNAGFLAAKLQSLPLAECLRWGNFCGGRSVTGVGGTSTAPRAAELRAWLAASRTERQGD